MITYNLKISNYLNQFNYSCDTYGCSSNTKLSSFLALKNTKIIISRCDL
jgi:hypothetical protein